MDNDFFMRLRIANVDRVSYFAHGGLHDDEGWGYEDWGCAVFGEGGELANVLKKIRRQADFDKDILSLTAEASAEIADVVIYMDLIAAKVGLPPLSLPSYISPNSDSVTRMGNRLAVNIGSVCNLLCAKSTKSSGLFDIDEQIEFYIGMTMINLHNIARVLELDLDLAIASKFNRTSERYKFSQRVELSL